MWRRAPQQAQQGGLPPPPRPRPRPAPTRPAPWPAAPCTRPCVRSSSAVSAGERQLIVRILESATPRAAHNATNRLDWIAEVWRCVQMRYMYMGVLMRKFNRSNANWGSKRRRSGSDGSDARHRLSISSSFPSSFCCSWGRWWRVQLQRWRNLRQPQRRRAPLPPPPRLQHAQPSLLPPWPAAPCTRPCEASSAVSAWERQVIVRILEYTTPGAAHNATKLKLQRAWQRTPQ
jgi:hypothetical protein